MGAMVSQITSLTIVSSAVYSDADQRKHHSSASLAFVQRIHRGTGEFPAQKASDANSVSIWWRQHVNNKKDTESADFPVAYLGLVKQKQSSHTSNSLPRMLQNVLCSDLTCQFHENPRMCFPVMLRTDIHPHPILI